MTDLNQFNDSLKFPIKDAALLRRVFTHRSILNEPSHHATTRAESNERLEFLGDSVLSTVISTLLWVRFPESNEGELTSLRARLVNGVMLARIATKVGMDRYLLLGKGEAASGGRENITILSGALEALIGAVYIDSGFAHAFTFTEALFDGLIDETLSEPVHFDYKPRLQELAQAIYKTPPTYRLISETGPAHDRLFTVEVVVGHDSNDVLGKGTAKKKKEAEQLAAQGALLLIGGLKPTTPETAPTPSTPPTSPTSNDKND
ncbi:MAG: ribonuclease III [Proteobacteria bacterium]|nr:ribonuclease III [Pseudomonadota bacterium]